LEAPNPRERNRIGKRVRGVCLFVGLTKEGVVLLCLWALRGRERERGEGVEGDEEIKSNSKFVS